MEPIISFKTDGEPYFTVNANNRSQYDANVKYYIEQYLAFKQQYLEKKQQEYNRNVAIFKTSIYEVCAHGKTSMVKQMIPNTAIQSVKKLQNENTYVNLYLMTVKK